MVFLTQLAGNGAFEVLEIVQEVLVRVAGS
jgi:hypothetical protein